MQFQIVAYDFMNSETYKLRLANREAHLKLGDEMIVRGELLFGAAHLDANGKMVGSTMIVEFPSELELKAWLKVEPYVTGKVWDKITITPCRVGPPLEWLRRQDYIDRHYKDESMNRIPLINTDKTYAMGFLLASGLIQRCE